MSEMPDWATSTPNVPLHELRQQQGLGDLTRPFTAQQLLEIGAELIEQFLKKVVQAVVGFFIPGGGTAFEQLSDWAINNVLNIPLTALGAIFDAVGGTFFSSLIPGLDASKIISGTFGLEFISGLLDGDGNILESLLGLPMRGIQGLIDMIVNALEGTPGHEGNPLSLVFTGLNGIREGLSAAHEVADTLASYFQDMSSLLVQIVQQATVRPVLGIIDQVMDAVSFWIFGWFHRTEKAHTASNAGIAALRGEMNAKIASVVTGTEGLVDPFDTDTTATRYITAGGYSTSVWTDDLDGSGHLEPPTSAVTMYSNVDPATDNIDVEMALVNVSRPGRAALWIGNASGTAGIGVRIDNQIGFATKQRLQLFTPNSFSNKNMHGNLYSEDVGTWHEGDVVRLRKNATTGVHKAYLNDIEVCSWDDSSGPVSDGVSFRKVGWQQNIEGSNTNKGPGLDFFHAYDWTS